MHRFSRAPQNWGDSSCSAPVYLRSSGKRESTVHCQPEPAQGAELKTVSCGVLEMKQGNCPNSGWSSSSSSSLQRNPIYFSQKRKQNLTCNALCFFLMALFRLACFCTEEKASEKASSPTNFLSSSMISWERFFSVGSNKTKWTCLIFSAYGVKAKSPVGIPLSLLEDDYTDLSCPICCRDQSKGACEICSFFTSLPRGPQGALYTDKQKITFLRSKSFFKRIMESQRLLKVYSHQGFSGIGFVGNKNDSSLVSQHLCPVCTVRPGWMVRITG